MLQNHFYRCPRFPVSCPNRCDPTKIPREDIESHVREHCPSVSVPCTFHHAGCKHMVSGKKYLALFHSTRCSEMRKAFRQCSFITYM